MRYFIILTSVMLLCKYTVAAGDWNTSGGRPAALGQSSASLVDFWSVTNNQAGMAFYDKTAVGVYFENRFLVKELGYQTGAVCFSTPYGNFGANVTYTGNANYSDMKAGLAYAKKLGEHLALGLQFDYLHTALGENYGQFNGVTFEAGLMIKITRQLTFGSHVFNPIPIKIADYNERIPTIYTAGFSYNFNDKLLLTAEGFKRSNFPLEFRSGAEYKVAPYMQVRAGVATQPFRYTFGVGFVLKGLHIDISSSLHSQLGYSPQASLHYVFGK